MSPAPAVRVLAVCTANQFRSPLVEFSLRRRCKSLDLPWVVTSAGTRAVPGQPAPPSTVQLLRTHGDDASGWRSTLLDPGIVADSDVILTATVEHRNKVVQMLPRSAARTFLVRQLAGYAARGPLRLVDPDASRSSLERWLAEARDALPAAPHGMDLADPAGRPYRALRRLDAVVEESVRLLSV